MAFAVNPTETALNPKRAAKVGTNPSRDASARSVRKTISGNTIKISGALPWNMRAIPCTPQLCKFPANIIDARTVRTANTHQRLPNKP